MKKIIRCSDMRNKGRSWLISKEVDNLVKGCTAQEKRLIGKISISKNPAEYLGAVVDTIDVLGVGISDSFDKFLEEGLEKIITGSENLIRSSKKISNRRRIQGSYECQYMVTPWRDEDELNLSPFLTYREAQEAGEEYYPDGYDIEEYCPEDEEY